MNQGDELKSVKAKIAALAAKTVESGCSEAEAISAMGMVGKLLKQYNLSMTEVMLRNENFLSKQVTFNEKMRTPIHYICMNISKFCTTKVWTSRNLKKEIVFNFFGCETDVDMSIYLMEMIESMMRVETKKFKLGDIYSNRSSHGKSVTNSFKLGIITRLKEKLANS